MDAASGVATHWWWLFALLHRTPHNEIAYRAPTPYHSVSRNDGRRGVANSAIVEDPKEAIRQALLPRKLELIQLHATWSLRHESYALLQVIDGVHLDPERIAHFLEKCPSEQEHCL